jgi:hypothetical protein
MTDTELVGPWHEWGKTTDPMKQSTKAAFIAGYRLCEREQLQAHIRHLHPEGTCEKCDVAWAAANDVKVFQFSGPIPQSDLEITPSRMDTDPGIPCGTYELDDKTGDK